ncbi:nucleoid occlusion factor SlmA [Hydrogenophaga sp. ANAO-22]|jgi:TetR/AcrR family transcriptional regulator|uniref:nucleoid occlusion factor SlmA n=1 Tax=Hydrogenophaga sp. ANAO-22 TaxID=3166645 RepID=UPI0036D3545E
MTSNAPESPSPEDKAAAAREAAEAIDAAAHADGGGGRKRPKPGERRVQILEALATMLQQPGAERITTAALAAKLEVSEAALYRHFASKAQMFEGLIEFIEQSVFGLINQLGEREADANVRSRKLVTLLLQFGEKNPGMTRVMVGDALVFENERLQQRMNLFFDKIEAALRQNLRETSLVAGAATPTVDAQADASAITAFCVGRLQRFARSGFKRSPSESLEHSLALLLPIVRH